MIPALIRAHFIEKKECDKLTELIGPGTPGTVKFFEEENNEYLASRFL